MPFSEYMAAGLLNSFFAQTSNYGALASAPTLYVGVSSTEINPLGGNNTEPTTGGYARVATTAATWQVSANQDPSWAATTAYALDAYIVDSNGNRQQATTAGTSGSSAPTWNTTVGGTTTDGTVTWTLIGPEPQIISNSALIQFPKATADWLSGTNLAYFGVWDAATAGNLQFSGALAVAKPVLTNDTFEFPAGDLSATLTGA